MLTGISRSGRIIMGRLERGDDLEEGLLRICSDAEIRCGEIRALGALSHVELCAYDQKKLQYGPSRKYSGNLEILSLLGNISEKSGDRALHLHATLARDTDNGIQVIGGHVLSGKVFACELTVHTCEDLILRRGKDTDTGLTLWTEKIQFPAPGPDDLPDAGPQAAAPPPPSPTKEPKKKKPSPKQAAKGKEQSAPGKAATPKSSSTKKDAAASPKDEVSWDDVLSATLEKSEPKKKVKAPDKPPVALSPGEAEEEEEAPEAPEEEIVENWKDVEIIDPQPGDIVVHPRFGKCKVERLEDGEFLHVRLESGRSVRLNMEVINLQISGYEGGQQIFETKIGGS